MARRIIVRAFDPAKPVYARKGFRANGREFWPGQELDWKKLAINQRRVRQMYDAGYVHHGDERHDKPSVRELKMQESAERRDADIARNIGVEKEEPVAEYPKHVGGPWYELSNGSKVMGKDKAEQAQSEL